VWRPDPQTRIHASSYITVSTPGSALPDPRVIKISLTLGSVLPGSARQHGKEFFFFTALTPGSILPGSARHHGEEFLSESDARIRTPGSARRHEKFDNDSDVRIRTPGSARHKIIWWNISPRPDLYKVFYGPAQYQALKRYGSAR